MPELYQIYLNYVDGQLFALANGTSVRVFIGPPAPSPGTVVTLPEAATGMPVVPVIPKQVDPAYAAFLESVSESLQKAIEEGTLDESTELRIYPPDDDRSDFR